MTRGHVSDLHVLLPVTLCLPDGRELTIEFVVDTGFTGALALPVSAVEAIRLPYLGDLEADLANGATVELAVHEVTVRWHGELLHERLLATGRRPLLGTALLAGSMLSAQFVEDGLVTVDEVTDGA